MINRRIDRPRVQAPMPRNPRPRPMWPARMTKVRSGCSTTSSTSARAPACTSAATNTRGLHHLVYEILDNSIDEALAGHCTSILVKINADGSVTVVDDGRGIPVGIHPTEKIPTVEVVFATLGAGGKFDHKDGSAYATSGGLHGVGASVVNFLSEWLEVEVSRDGKVYHMEFERGLKSSDLKVIGSAAKTGTKVTFKPDREIFNFADNEFKYEMLASRLRELAFLNEGLQIAIEDERTGKREDFKYDHGPHRVRARASMTARTSCTPASSISRRKIRQSRLVVEVAMQYSDGYNETILTFANNINNHDGGTHLSGFKTALTGTINRHAEAAGWLKDTRPSGDDVREGLVAIISVKLPEPQFESQTKDKLLNGEVESFVQQAVNEKLGSHFEENPKEAKIDFRERDARRRGARSRPQGPRADAPQELPRRRQPARQARRLPQQEQRRHRAVPRRRRFRRRHRQAGPRFQRAGDPGPPRQAAERREGQPREDARPRGNSHDHQRPGLRHPRRFQPGKTPLRQDHHHDRRRRGRQPHPHAAAHLLLPPHAGADPQRPGLCRPAAALHGHAPQERASTCSTSGRCARP